jgi:hypothetical protein
VRDYLVYIRAGKHSLHAEMLAGDPGRNWDCCLNAWAATPGETAQDHGVEYLERGGINKFEAFAASFGRDPEAMPYRFVLMLDDDLRFMPGDVSRFFEQCERHSLALCQPAIAWGSHANHVINLWNPVCDTRQVNFIEVMAPCFSQSAMADLLPTFTLTRCTWGIDYAWSSLLNGSDRMTVVDAVPMHHTKPMDRAEGPFYQMLRRMDIDPEAELAAVHRNFPPWGAMRTLASGHGLRTPVPQAAGDQAVAWMEQHKLQAHLAAGGSIAPQAELDEDGRPLPARAAASVAT